MCDSREDGRQERHPEVGWRAPREIDARSPRAARYRYTRTPAPEALRRSLEAVGVLQPLVAVREGEDLVLVTGFRRLALAVDLGIDAVPVRIAPNGREAFREGLWENLTHRRFHPVERAAILRRLEEVLGIDPDRIRREWAARLGIPPTEGMVRLYRRIDALDREARALLAADAIDVRHVEILLAMDPAAQSPFLAQVIRRGRASVGLARGAWRLLRDIALRERRGIAAILEEEARAEGEGRAWLEDLLARLRRRSRPARAAAEARFAEAARGLGLPGSVRIEPPAGFEGDTIRFSFAARDGGEYARIAGRLADPAAVRAACALWRILREGA